MKRTPASANLIPESQDSTRGDNDVMGGLLDGALRTREAQRHNIRVFRQVGVTAVGQCMLAEHVSEPEVLSGKELVAAEWLHMGYLDGSSSEQRNEFAAKLGLTQPRMDQIYEVVSRDVEMSSQLIVDKAQEALEDDELLGAISDDLTRGFSAKIVLEKDMSPLVLATLLMMQVGHEGQTRKDDKEYYTHPLTTMLLFQIAWDQVEKEWRENGRVDDVPSRQDLFDQLAVNGCHDVVEDLFPYGSGIPNGQSIMTGEHTHITPLVMASVYKKIPSDNGHSPEQLVEANARLTKIRDEHGNTTSKDAYVVGCMRSALTIFGKLCDTLHNKVMNPKTHSGVSEEERQHNEKSMLEYAESLRVFEDYIIMNNNEWDAAIVKKLGVIAQMKDSEFMSLVGQTRLGAQALQ